MAQKNWQVRRLAAALGAEITGVTLADTDDSEKAAIRDLLHEHKVIFFPGQHMAAGDHVEFGRFFGPLEGHPNLKDRNAAEHPELFRLEASSGGIADEWHTDLTFQAQPALMSILNMKKCPDVGGDTMWTSLFAAYEGLSPPLKEMCDGLSALHDAHPHDRSDRMAIHPLVRIDPESGRKALYVNEHFTRRIVEMRAQESDLLLGYLTKWVQQPAFTVRYNWTEGTICMWDNRYTQHYVVNDFVGERVIERVTVMGDRPVGNRPRWAPWPDGGRGSAMYRHDRQLSRFLRSQASEEAAE
ncbi:MAG: TauD/TfdA dioxygenase family protein [Minwuia sp.]|uniref:TauD/TfdA dioxygenase family protein n=1 Tax=Minwuia sp. TaxID=2493630 RepID=UPI003A85787B